MNVLMLVGAGLLALFVLLILLPKKKASEPAQQPQMFPYMPQVMPQYFPPQYPQYAPPPPQPAPAPQLSHRQQEIQEKVRVLTEYFVDTDEEIFRKRIVDEALAAMQARVAK